MVLLVFVKRSVEAHPSNVFITFFNILQVLLSKQKHCA